MVDWRHGDFGFAFKTLFVSSVLTGGVALLLLHSAKSYYQVDDVKQLMQTIRTRYGINVPGEDDAQLTRDFIQLINDESDS
jgi:hypothetical protein